METINMYLENMFLNLPDNEEVRRAKEELHSMMEDKYTELKSEGKTENEAVGIVISEFGNLEELAEELGLSRVLADAPAKEEKTFVTSAEVKEYMEANHKSAGGISWGVVLCILGVIPLILLGGLSDVGKIKESVAGAIGMTVLFVMIAIAVGLFIVFGMAMEKYDKYKKLDFSLNGATQRMLTDEKNQFKPVFTLCITVGVILCIVGVLPLIVVGCLFEEAELLEIICLAVLLLLVAAATKLFVWAGMRYDVFQILLQENDYEKKESNRIVDAVGGIYWLVVTAIYLAWSFITMNWGFTWIVWPIAGVLFAAVATAIRTFADNK